MCACHARTCAASTLTNPRPFPSLSQLSRQRFVTVQADASSIFASIAGDRGEQVNLLVVNGQGQDVRVVCYVGTTGAAILACDAGAGCRCR